MLDGGEEEKGILGRGDIRAIYTICGNGNMTGIVASWLIIIVNLSGFRTHWKHTSGNVSEGVS